VLWLSLAWFALQPANRAPLALHDLIARLADGEPGWLAGIENGAAAAVGSHGLAASIMLAAACVLVAAGVWLPRPAVKATLVLALVVAGLIWVVGEAFGMILAGGATDPNSGLLLALLALAYWPAKQRQARGERASSC
jgi:energy-converting hydrogenase Eha subunit C